MGLQGDAGVSVEPEDGADDVVEVTEEPLGGHGRGGTACAGGEPADDVGEPGAHGGGSGPGAGGGEGGDADGVVPGAEGVVADHDVEAGDGGAVRGVDGQPGGVADDVEARMGGLPLVDEAGPEQPVDLDAAVELLAEVLAAGVGDAQAEGELEHGRGAGAVHGADGGGGVPGGAVGAEVVEEAAVEEGADVGTVAEFAGLPGVEGQGHGAGGNRESLREAVGELFGGDGPALFGPGGVGGQEGGVDGEPVEGEGAVQFG